MNQQRDRTLQQTVTTLGAAEVLAAAKHFFARRNSIYSAFVEKEGPTFVALRGQGGEEVIIGVAPAEGGTSVAGSTYIFDQQVARFLATLPAPPSTKPLPPAGVPSGDGASVAATGATTPGAAGAVPAPADAQTSAGASGGSTPVTKASTGTGAV
jgi:hypothetical protein